QNRDGGWGWWSGEASRPVLTAYALLALFTARQAGFLVDADVMSRAEQYLVTDLNRSLDVNDTSSYNERAFVVFVLSEMGRSAMVSRAITLYDQRAHLDLYGKAYLLMALKKTGQSQAQAVLSELTSAAITSATGAHWEEKQPDFWGMNTNTRTTALAIMAISRADPKNALLANAVRWLMVARKEGHWETTQVTAWSVLALTEFMASTGELSGSYTYQVTVNGKPIGDGSVDKNNVDQSRELRVAIRDMLQTASAEVAITRGPGDGKLYYSAYLNYFLPADKIAALNKGIVVGRQYFAVDNQTLKPSDRQVESASIGDYVQVRLTVVAPNDLHYMVLEDPLPAGFEAVDNTLLTASAAVSSPQLKSGVVLNPGDVSPSAGRKPDRYFSPFWQYWAHTEIHDDRVAVFATYLGRGVYEYSYTIRAGLAGAFLTLPARAWEMYFPETFGRSGGTLFTVK
ncbi:MAG: alpha-2-macroglobulin, partial [Chloroflexota bacterium]|nr:alpha-2-macroglobulin [Chloroflexota bacterium]